MSSKQLIRCAFAVGLAVAGQNVFAQAESAAPAEADEAPAPKLDEALLAETGYAEALVEAALPDFAQVVIEAAKKKWPGPEAEALFFAIEISADLSLGKFEEAEKKIAALPDRKSSKYWGARLAVANNFAAHGQKKECSAIYEEFFKVFAKPPAELRSFFLQASFAYGQILIADKQFEKAAERYSALLKQINKDGSEDEANSWCNVACETCELYLRLAAAVPDVKGAPDVKARAKYLDPAKKLIDKLLWSPDKPVFFGRAIAMLAHVELLKGDVKKAQAVIDDYMDQLAEIHKAIKEVDPDGRLGLLRQSAMPLCRYMLAEILWNEAQKAFKAANRDDAKIKDLMFGAIVAGKKRNGQGAFNHALNVFIQYPESAWAAKAGEMSEAIREFAEKNYNAKIKTNVTAEQLATVRAMQFRAGFEKVAENDYEGAITDLFNALKDYPEGKESIQAVEMLIKCYSNLIMRKKNDPAAVAWRQDLDAIEGYLSERFAGCKDKALMTMAGDATVRAAIGEKERGEITRADTLQKAFYVNYTRHANAPNMAAAAAGEAQTAERWADAIALWKLFGEYYKNDNLYGASLASLAYCYDKAGDRANAIAAMKRYLDPADNKSVDENLLRKSQIQMNLAMTYQKDGFAMIDQAATNQTEEAVNKQVAMGCAQIIRGIKQFKDFAAFADKMLADPAVTAKDKEQYTQLKEGALFLAGDSWRRLKKPEAKLEDFRKRAAASLEDYVKQFPKGKYAAKSYVLLGTLYTAIGDIENSKGALDRLTKQFPDSEEARDAKPRLAKSLIEMGMEREATDIYSEMIRSEGGNYTCWDFVRAGESLIDAKSWGLADQAFEKAISLAGTNHWSAVARARIGQAKSLYRQKNYAEAREAIDAILENQKLKNLPQAADANFLLVDVASEQGVGEKRDARLRASHFGAAMAALKRLRNGYWRQKPQEERDKLDIMSAEIRIRRMNAEEAMGLKEEAVETARGAAGSLQAFLQSRVPTPEQPLEKMTAVQIANLEQAYTLLVPLFTKIPDQGSFVLKFGQEYMNMFPNGAARTEIQNCINQAKASGAVLTEETENAAAAAAAAGAAAEAAQPEEKIEVVPDAEGQAEQAN